MDSHAFLPPFPHGTQTPHRHSQSATHPVPINIHTQTPHDKTAFAAAVDWSERWIQGLVAFHLVLWVAVLALRKNMTAQVNLYM